MKYTVYSIASGEVLRNIESPPDQISYQIFSGEAYFEGLYEVSDFYFSGGNPVAYSPTEKAAKANRPAYSTAWSNVTMSWNDPRSLNQAKLDKAKEIRAARDEVIFGPFEAIGYTFDGDRDAQNNFRTAYQSAVMALQYDTPYSITWTLADDSAVTLSALDVYNVGNILINRVRYAYEVERNLRAIGLAATTVAEVDAITWTYTLPPYVLPDPPASIQPSIPAPTLAAAPAGVTTENIIAKWAIPAGYITSGMGFSIQAVTQTAAASLLTFRVRVGAAGTTADTQAVILTETAAQAANAYQNLNFTLQANTGTTIRGGGFCIAQAAILGTVTGANAATTIAPAEIVYISLSVVQAATSGIVTPISANLTLAG